MTASSIATMVVFASLGVLALALGLLARRYSGRALAIGLLGLLAVTTASTFITYARPNADVHVIDKLNAEIAALKRELRRSREREREGNRTAAARAENDQIRADLAEAQSKAAELDATAKLLTADLEAARSKVAELEKKLPPAPQASPPPQGSGPTQIDPGILRRKLVSDTFFYSSRQLTERELVAGLAGTWYVIRLKLGGKPFVFGARQFRMPEAVKEIKESALQLQKEILAHVAKRSRLFLRGGADSRPIAGATEVPDAREIQILPRSKDNNNYEATPQLRLVTEPVRNDDLPNLRADWFRQQIRTVISTVGTAEMEILENRPSRDQERTVDLILYAEW